MPTLYCRVGGGMVLPTHPHSPPNKFDHTRYAPQPYAYPTVDHSIAPKPGFLALALALAVAALPRLQCGGWASLPRTIG